MTRPRTPVEHARLVQGGRAFYPANDADEYLHQESALRAAVLGLLRALALVALGALLSAFFIARGAGFL